MINYLAAALWQEEQEEQEEQETDIDLDLKAPMTGIHAGESGESLSPPTSSIQPTPSIQSAQSSRPVQPAPSAEQRWAESGKEAKSAQKEISWPEREQDGATEKISRLSQDRSWTVSLDAPGTAFPARAFELPEQIRKSARGANPSQTEERSAIWRPEPTVQILSGIEKEMPAPAALAAALQRAKVGVEFVRRERRSLSVTLPETPATAGRFSAEDLDRTVERDARRYDGGFSLY